MKILALDDVEQSGQRPVKRLTKPWFCLQTVVAENQIRVRPEVVDNLLSSIQCCLCAARRLATPGQGSLPAKRGLEANIINYAPKSDA